MDATATAIAKSVDGGKANATAISTNEGPSEEEKKA